MKTLKPLLVLSLLLCMSLSAFSAARQGNWRWRNDDGGETTATWKAAENTHITLTHYNNIRLRVEMISPQNVQHISGEPVYLGYSYNDGVSWVIIEDDVTSDHFVYSTSPFFSNQTPTTNQLTSEEPSFDFVPGFLFDTPDASNEHPYMTGSETTELEFCIRATQNALNEVEYSFRVFWGGNIELTGIVTPTLFTDFSGSAPIAVPFVWWASGLAVFLLLLGGLFIHKRVV